MSVTETWKLDGDMYALYSDDPVICEAAKEAGLTPDGEYYRPRKNGKNPVGWKFKGDKDTVLSVVSANISPPPKRSKKKKVCQECGRKFKPYVGKEKSKYCGDKCKKEARRRQDRERKRQKAV